MSLSSKGCCNFLFQLEMVMEDNLTNLLCSNSLDTLRKYLLWDHKHEFLCMDFLMLNSFQCKLLAKEDFPVCTYSIGSQNLHNREHTTNDKVCIHCWKYQDNSHLRTSNFPSFHYQTRHVAYKRCTHFNQKKQHHSNKINKDHWCNSCLSKNYNLK